MEIPVSFPPAVRTFRTGPHAREPAVDAARSGVPEAEESRALPRGVVRLALTAQHRDFGIQVPMDAVDRVLGLEASDAARMDAAVVGLGAATAVVDVLAASALAQSAAWSCAVLSAALLVLVSAKPAERLDQFGSAEE